MTKLLTAFLITVGSLYAMAVFYGGILDKLDAQRGYVDWLPGVESREEYEKRLLEAAENNDVYAMVQLGIGYDTGAFGAPQAKESLKWLREARRWDSPIAAYLLGAMLQEGRSDVRRDYREAFQHLTIASESGIPQAFGRIGVMHEKGQGRSKNPMEALYNFSMAYRLGADSAHEDASRVAKRVPEGERNSVTERVNRNLIVLQNVRDNTQLSGNLLEIIEARETIKP